MKINFETVEQVIEFAELLANAGPEIVAGFKAAFGALSGSDFTHAEFVAILNGYRAAAEERDKQFHKGE